MHKNCCLGKLGRSKTLPNDYLSSSYKFRRVVLQFFTEITVKIGKIRKFLRFFASVKIS
jgi:hypothetical protein